MTTHITGGRRVQLTLATKDDTGVQSAPDFSSKALADFDLTRSETRDLIKSHCRFQ